MQNNLLIYHTIQPPFLRVLINQIFKNKLHTENFIILGYNDNLSWKLIMTGLLVM